MSKQPLKDLAQVVRSKNAGPFEITFDMIFPDQPTYERVKTSNVITKETIANLYQIHLEDIVELVYFDQAYAINFRLNELFPQERLENEIPMVHSSTLHFSNL
jgi:hypothetical protein